MSSVSEKKTRMPADERRELILDAATAVFGDAGYYGATTDAVARAAGVSQPYVVRMFGTKEQLFLDVLGRGLERIFAAFREAIAGDPQVPLERRLGLAYFELTADRGILLCLMHAFALGADPVIGPAARCGFLDVYRLLRDEAGMTPEQANGFLAGGMLANVVLGVRMFDDFETDPDVRELMTSVFPEKLDLVRASHPPVRTGAPPRA
ncbi:TetR/AcrR family transcriptional regulator [Herbiconiux sp. SALV-R1]|uniref:TetR/AcrR family transcriptional regulator n=1 Tax=Herbiconiux sp. SALV-R1 TaxID=2735133 RepID=UPI001490B940|nr:TetR/AcrR family transcriptional regulator [Herbiconiux sp. SALV-R1]QJU52883.1 TetR/AcrR family transcriptional regulator [Herbiconiux sp. SALV-R1]